MSKKKYTIIMTTIIILIIAVVIFFLGMIISGKGNTLLWHKTKSTTANNHGYQIEDISNSPKSSLEVMKGEIIQESNLPLQKFIIKDMLDGSTRQLYTTNEKNITFENIQPQNWSPTDRFVYVYMDYPNRKDIIFFKTDGRFTNAEYYLHATGLYPTINVVSAKWLNETTLELQATDINTHKPETFIADFDDDTGFVTKCPGGPNTCNVDDN